MRALNAQPLHCTLVGDSVSDIVAARRAGVASVGYANKPGKHEKLRDAGADCRDRRHGARSRNAQRTVA